jgi:cobalt-zinc-cadmium efflux system membrane fusion protein
MMRTTTLVTTAVLAAAAGIAVWHFRDDLALQEWTSPALEMARPVLGSAESKSATHDDLDHDEETREARATNPQSPHRHSNGDEHDRGEGQPAEAAEPAGEESHGESVELNESQMKEFGIEVAVADEGPIALHLDRPAEVKFSGDRLVHVVPSVAGVVTKVIASQGQAVAEGDVMAVLNSRELAELKAAHLADFQRRNLARDTFEREKALWEKKISSEKDYLDARAALAEAEIALRASGQKLLALGFSSAYVEALTDTDNADLTKYEIRAPISGTVIERHVSLGEAASADKETFLIADPSTVWIDVTLYPRDMPLVKAGQDVSIDVGDGSLIHGKVAFVTPHVSEETRTAVARVINGSVGGRLKPGLFVKANIEVGEDAAAVRLPKSAIQNYEDGQVVFVKEGEKFEPRPIKLGRSNSDFVEVLSGVGVGETYVTQGSFVLKAELEKSSFGDGHNH